MITPLLALLVSADPAPLEAVFLSTGEQEIVLRRPVNPRQAKALEARGLGEPGPMDKAEQIGTIVGGCHTVAIPLGPDTERDVHVPTPGAVVRVFLRWRATGYVVSAVVPAPKSPATRCRLPVESRP